MEEKASPEFHHIPVLLSEVLDGLAIRPDGIYVDGTVGGAGHSSEIARRLTPGKGRLIALDQDDDAIAAATSRLSVFGDVATVVKSNFINMKSVCASLGVEKIDGFLLDLGVSSFQLDTPERGFSYMADAPLSMKMDRDAGLDAYYVVNSYSRDELCRIFRDYGEEKFAFRIADRICAEREKAPIATTFDLNRVILAALPDGGKSQKHSPYMRVYQSVRCEVNHEIDILQPALADAVSLLRAGGRGCVITFHSVEDRAVKEAFADLGRGCICPRNLPVCVCGRTPQLKNVCKKPIVPGEAELQLNSRSHSAKLRVIEKL